MRLFIYIARFGTILLIFFCTFTIVIRCVNVSLFVSSFKSCTKQKVKPNKFKIKTQLLSIFTTGKFIKNVSKEIVIRYGETNMNTFENLQHLIFFPLSHRTATTVKVVIASWNGVGRTASWPGYIRWQGAGTRILARPGPTPLHPQHTVL